MRLFAKIQGTICECGPGWFIISYGEAWADLDMFEPFLHDTLSVVQRNIEDITLLLKLFLVSYTVLSSCSRELAN